MNPSVRLSPPQYTLYRQLAGSIGADPNVRVRNPYQQNEIWYMDVQVSRITTAKAMSGIITSYYDFGGIIVNVRILGPSGESMAPQTMPDAENPVDFVHDQIVTALKRNRYFERVVDLRGKKPPLAPWGQLAVVFEPKVIQFWDDNLADPFGYLHFVAQDVFSAIMLLQYPGNVKITMTTAVWD